jgi:hypothetical protein
MLECVFLVLPVLHETFNTHTALPCTILAHRILTYTMLSCTALPHPALLNLTRPHSPCSTLLPNLCLSPPLTPTLISPLFLHSLPPSTGGRLGHGDNEPCLLPKAVYAMSLMDLRYSKTRDIKNNVFRASFLLLVFIFSSFLQSRLLFIFTLLSFFFPLYFPPCSLFSPSILPPS